MPLADSPAQHAPAQHAPAHHAQARLDRTERAVYRAVNRVRRQHHLPTLRLAPRIAFVADMHSDDQTISRFLSHSSSDGTPFRARIRQVVRARSVGETIIRYQGRLAGRSIVGAWMRSPTHRREIMTPGYGRIGVGHASASGFSVVTADFATGR